MTFAERYFVSCASCITRIPALPIAVTASPFAACAGSGRLKAFLITIGGVYSKLARIVPISSGTLVSEIVFSKFAPSAIHQLNIFFCSEDRRFLPSGGMTSSSSSGSKIRSIIILSSTFPATTLSLFLISSGLCNRILPFDLDEP